jgi:hypothetical protein
MRQAIATNVEIVTRSLLHAAAEAWGPRWSATSCTRAR